MDGGPTVLVEPGGPTPVSAVYLWFRAGTAMEPPDLHGGAHFLEHLLFKGAGEHGVGEAAERIEALGGDLNAFTSYEQTVLHATLPSGREPEAIRLLAEMALRPHLNADELDRERDVVIEEIRGSHDDATQLLAETVRARIYGAHPYGRPVLGTEESVRGFSRDRLLDFHARGYSPSNAVLAVAGQVDPDQILAVAAEALARPGLAPEPGPPATPERPVKDRFFTLDQGFEERLVELAFPTPGLAHPDMAALDLLITALGSGESSLLSLALKREHELALDCWAALENELRGGLCVFGLVAREDRVADAARTLASELVRVARDGLPVSALHRARQSILSSRIYERETVDGRAHRLAWYEAFFRDPARESAYEAALLRVSPADLRAVAGRWLRPERAVAGAVCPAEQVSAAQLGRAVTRGFSRPPAPARGERLVRATLPNGARVVVLPEEDTELASVSVVGVGGALAEGARNRGLADVWAASLARGAGDLDARALSEAVQERGGALSPWAWRNSCGVTATFPAGELRSGLDLVIDVLARPTFDPDEVDRAREELDEARQTVADAPSDLAWDLAWQLLYAGHPWGRPAHGTAGGLARSTPRRLRDFHRRVFAGENLVIALAGAVDPDRAIDALRRGLRDLPAGAAIPWSPPVLEERFERSRRARVARQQAQLVVAFPGAGWGTPEAAALSLLESVLGGQGGRLFVELREKAGLAYDVSASSEDGLGGGTFLCAMGTDPARVDEARAGLWRVLDEVTAAPIAEAELARARARVVDGAVLDLQRSSERAAQLASAERYGPGAEHLDALMRAPAAIDASTLHAVAASVLRRDRSAQVLVGPRR